MLKCYLGRFSVRRRCVAPHYRLHWATKIRKIREINTFRHYFSPRGPKKCAAAKWAQGRNATAMRAGGAGGAGGRATGQRRAGTRAGQDARAGGAHEPAGTRRRAADRTEGGGPDGGVDGWTGSQVQQPVQRPVQQPAQRPTCCSSHSRRASPRKSTATTRRSPSSSRLCGMVRMSNRRNRES